MDSSTAAIENEAAFAFEDSAERPLFEAALTRPTADPVLDQNSSDLELCQLAASGSLAAFEIIYQRYHRRTYSLTMRMTNNSSEGVHSARYSGFRARRGRSHDGYFGRHI